MDPNTKISKSQNPSTGTEYAIMHHIFYCEAIGTLMYAMLGPQPDILFSTTTISKFLRNTGMPHWEAVKQIYRYLNGTTELWLTYGGDKKRLMEV